ncbi:sugar ABC transporter permease, partial [Streptomyces niveus]
MSALLPSATPRRTRERGPRRTPPLVLAFVLVPLLAEAVWVFWPALQGFYLALTDWDGVSPPRFVGLGNFREMAHD